jgi:hypothetical protein
MIPDTPPAPQRGPSREHDPSRASSEDTARRVLAALRRSAAQARRVAAQTGTRLVVVRDGKLVIEPVETEPGGVSKGEATSREAASPPEHTTGP